jgi:hypothetical protein
VALDQFLQYTEEQEVNRLITKLKNEEVEQRRRMLEEWKDAPALYEAIVHRKYKGLGGTKGLRGVRVQDRLEVLQENVGPGKTYSLCRRKQAKSNDSSETEAEISIGWFPTSLMSKIESKPKDRAIKSKRFWLF